MAIAIAATSRRPAARSRWPSACAGPACSPTRAAAAARASTLGSPPSATQAARAGHFRRRARRARRHHLRRARAEPGSRPAEPLAELSRFPRPRRHLRPAGARPRAAAAARRHFPAHRAPIRRARPGHRRLLGAGDRLRRLHGRFLLAPLARDARLRLPPPGALRRRARRCAPHRRARRSRAGRRCAAPGPASSARSSSRRPTT